MPKTPDQLYAARENRLLHAIALKVQDRVPLVLCFFEAITKKAMVLI